jgi:hypothetical protein
MPDDEANTGSAAKGPITKRLQAIAAVIGGVTAVVVAAVGLKNAFAGFRPADAAPNAAVDATSKAAAPPAASMPPTARPEAPKASGAATDSRMRAAVDPVQVKPASIPPPPFGCIARGSEEDTATAACTFELARQADVIMTATAAVSYNGLSEPYIEFIGSLDGGTPRHRKVAWAGAQKFEASADYDLGIVDAGVHRFTLTTRSGGGAEQAGTQLHAKILQ